MTDLIDDGEFRELGWIDVGDAHDNERTVVVSRTAGACELIGGVQDRSRNILNASFRGQGSQQFPQPLEAELLLHFVFRFENSVRGENDDVARAQRQRVYVVIRFGEQDRKS